jgi:hypothetical protein
MADKVLVFNAKNSAADTIEDLYLSPSTGAGTKVKVFSATNILESSVDYSAYIYSSTGSLQDTVVPQTTVVRDRGDYGSLIIGQVIPAGGTLRVKSSQIKGINFYITGVEQ